MLAASQALPQRDLGIEAERPINRYLGLFDELGFDSLQSFQLMVVVEGLAGLQVPSENPPGMFTMDDAYRYYTCLARGVDPDGVGA